MAKSKHPNATLDNGARPSQQGLDSIRTVQAIRDHVLKHKPVCYLEFEIIPGAIRRVIIEPEALLFLLVDVLGTKPIEADGNRSQVIVQIH